ncbi:hypothetical protein KIH86_03560 [Paenibacillus sp. HN-1]|uniref:hypothetical protein n=1 Tax=Paenibacillus TaxID=44249 RepID=UPI001CA944A4|nr:MULTISPECIES: hypothetical protein [Paenibacillus]MBY9077259.1 hypothetical protein [Paenibacillus sp. CGMCC 1.18879]MBY9083306.1 hypothetical protein [Paenibacillus sinensis]
MDSYDFYITPEDYERAKANGITSRTLEKRIRDRGWSKERAITEPVQKKTNLLKWRRLAEENGIPPNAFYKRVRVSGWSLERAATEALIDKADRLRQYSKQNAEKNRRYPLEIIALAERNGISYNLFKERVSKYGWSLERAATEPKVSPSESGRRGKEWVMKNVGNIYLLNRYWRKI